MPLLTETNELPWRLYYQDQFNTYKANAATPPAGAPNVAYSVYFQEKQNFDNQQRMQQLQNQVNQLQNQNQRLINQNNPQLTP